VADVVDERRGAGEHRVGIGDRLRGVGVLLVGLLLVERHERCRCTGCRLAGRFAPQVAFSYAGRLQRREDLREESRNVLDGGTCAAPLDGPGPGRSSIQPGPSPPGRREEQAEEQRYGQAEERRRQEITAKSWPDQIKQAVLDQKAHIGMTTTFTSHMGL